MRLLFPSLLLLLATSPVVAQDLATTCHASSSYDLTLQPGGLLFDRASPAPMQVRVQQGELETDGQRIPLQAEEQDRLTLFERQLRALVPRVKQLARQGVDIAVQTLRQQAGQLGLSAPTRAELDRRLAAQAAGIKQRIDASQSTHDWQGDAAQRYADQIMADLMPLVAGDLGQQALTEAMSGDLDGAARLRDQAAHLAANLQPLLQRRLASLRPQVEALCPAIDRLAELQQGVRGANGQPLRLLQVDSR